MVFFMRAFNTFVCVRMLGGGGVWNSILLGGGWTGGSGEFSCSRLLTFYICFFADWAYDGQGHLWQYVFGLLYTLLFLFLLYAWEQYSGSDFVDVCLLTGENWSHGLGEFHR